jgi:hypothetical protein
MKLATNSNQPPVLMEIAPAPGHEVSHAVPAADAAALSLVFLLVFCVFCFAWGAAILGRRKRKVSYRDAGNAPEDPAQASRGSSDHPVSPRADWERESDWWKKPR